MVVDGIGEPLLAANVSLSGLDAHVTEHELDLLKLAAGLMTQARRVEPPEYPHPPHVGPDFPVMELVERPTLAERIAKGDFP